VAKLLPQMKSNAEAKQLVSKVTKDDRKLVSQIKQILGPTSKTIFGVPTATTCWTYRTSTTAPASVAFSSRTSEPMCLARGSAGSATAC
jgi:hypothetical protein